MQNDEYPPSEDTFFIANNIEHEKPKEKLKALADIKHSLGIHNGTLIAQEMFPTDD